MEVKEVEANSKYSNGTSRNFSVKTFNFFLLIFSGKSDLRVIHETFQFWLPEDCNLLDDAKRQQITSHVLDRMQASQLCHFDKVKITEACSNSSVAVTCDKNREEEGANMLMGKRLRRTLQDFNLAIQLTLSFAIE